MTTELAQKRDEMEAQNAQPMVSMIERIASDPNVPIEKLERMLDMQERIQTGQRKAEHAEAKAAAMADMPSVPMNGKGHNGRPYSTLKDITSTTRPVLSKHGLALTFDVQVDNGQIIVTAILTHRNGHDERVSIPLPADNSGSKNAVQGIGSSQTYGQRYTAQAILGLSLGDDVEDDGAGGGGERITEDQFNALRDLLEQAGADEARMCAFFKVQHLGELPASKYGQADALLRSKLKKSKGGQ